MKTAFLIDCDFFIRRLRILQGDQTAEQVVAALGELWVEHLRLLHRYDLHLYRILVYDCPPLAKKVHKPISKSCVDLSKSVTFKFRELLHDLLRKQRKVALRLGKLSERHATWGIREEPLKQLLSRKRTVEELTDDDFELQVEQKGVDMRIGLDIASISSKKLADQIILVAGDSDFIPAAKMARREGVDFILDSMGAPIPTELHEHIDGLQTVLKTTKAKGK